jgi:plasmid maintenance system killer protein
LEALIEVDWTDRKLRKAQMSDRAGQRLLGDERWSALKRRIRTLESADTLADLHGLPGNFHPLSVDLAGEWSANLSANWRVIFESAEEPLPTFRDGGLDQASVRHVRVLRVEDYHGR